MSPQRALVAVALVLAAPIIAALTLGVPSLGGVPGTTGEADTPEPFVAVQSATPTAADRQTADETATTDGQSKTSRPDTGTISPTETPTATPLDETETTRSPTDTAVPTATPTDGGQRETPSQTATETVSSDETPTDDSPAASTDAAAQTETDKPTESPTATDSPTQTETVTPTQTETPPATDGGTDDPASRQCTHDRDGHDKPALPDATTPPGEATELESGSTVSDSVGIGGTNWYAIDVEKGETLSVVVEGSPESLSVAIFGPDGSPVDAIETRTPDPTAFGAAVDESGTYYVRVDAGDGFGGLYQLTAERAGPDPFDPNDGRSRALPVASGEETSATLTEGETDWYALKLPANSSLSATVTVEGHALGRDVRVDIYDADGERISKSTTNAETVFDPSTGSSSATVSANAPTEGIYYVRVSCAALDGHAGYTVTVEADTNA
jgi:hypothetical protein